MQLLTNVLEVCARGFLLLGPWVATKSTGYLFRPKAARLRKPKIDDYDDGNNYRQRDCRSEHRKQDIVAQLKVRV